MAVIEILKQAIDELEKRPEGTQRYFAWLISKHLENHYFPDVVTPPGETLREILEEHSLPPGDFARLIKLAEHDLKKILTGELEITPEIAIEIGKRFVNTRFWLQREWNYRDHLERQNQ